MSFDFQFRASPAGSREEEETPRAANVSESTAVPSLPSYPNGGRDGEVSGDGSVAEKSAQAEVAQSTGVESAPPDLVPIPEVDGASVPAVETPSVLESLNGHATPDTESAAAEPAQQREKKSRALGMPEPLRRLWQTRGLWLAAIGVGMALNGQRILTVDKDVTSSIRWYALGIIVTIIAWSGTYRNKSFLMMAVRKPKAEKAALAVEDTASVTTSAVPLDGAVVTPTGNGVEPAAGILDGEESVPIAPLPVRKRKVLAEESGTADEPAVVTTVPAHSADTGPSRSADTGPLRSSDTGPLPAIGTAPLGQLEPVDVAGAASASAQEPQIVTRVVAPVAATSSKPSTGLRARVAQWRERWPFLAGPWPRYVVAFAALLLNLYCADQLRKDYFSSVGGWGWVLSLIILAAAFLREPRREVVSLDEKAVDIEEHAQLVIPRWVEISILVGIVLLAFAVRIYRLDDLSGGMHGDEGEFGMDALGILNGDKTSPFLTGWFAHPNFSFYSIAIMMKIFGTGLFGLRIFSVLLGALMVLPLYGLARLWFGVRAAIIAGVLLAVMDVSIYFGKLGLNNITTPFFLVTGFYFLFRGMKSLRTLDFIMSGYAFMLTLFFYYGGRLTPFIVVAVLGYVFLFLPLVRVPGMYFDLRRVSEGIKPSRLKALGSAFAFQARSVLGYGGKLIIFVVACICLVSPWLVYYIDHRAEMDSRSNDKLVLNPANEGRMQGQYGVTHDPLYVGLRMPQPTDLYPWLPVVFEKTPISVQVANDGFWPRALWGQTTTTLSIFTYRFDASSFYTFTGEPATKPIEAVFLILGLAFAFWRWKDARMGALSIWFWMTVIVGGALTIDAPYMPRMVGLVPALAILIAIPLDKLAAEFVRAAGGLRDTWQKAKTIRFARPRLYAGQAVTSIALVALLLNLGATNINDYFNRYMAAWPYPEVAGQAYFVEHMNQEVTSEGRPTPQYFDLGIHFIYWGHGDNRFVNNGTPGADMTNPSNELPILYNDDRDVVFMVWQLNSHYLDEIEQYYPGGEEGQFMYGPNGAGPNLFTYYRVKKEQIDAQRITHATYTPSHGDAVMRDEPGFGTSTRPPADLQYPMQATWSGNIVAPSYGQYSFSLETSAGQPGKVVIDGQQVLTTTATTAHTETQLLLARGPHEVSLSGGLADEASQVSLKWAAGDQNFEPIKREYVWSGPGRALFGEVRPYVADLLSPPPDPASGGGIVTTRVDGFIGFRHSPEALTMAGGLSATWRGDLDIPQQGTYNFEVNSNGDSVVLIDNNIVVNNIRGGAEPHDATGQADLAAGKHTYELRYNFSGGTGYLEAFWTPPGGQRLLIDSRALHTTEGIVEPGQFVQPPPPVQLAPPAPPTTIAPLLAFGSGDLKSPRGIAVDKQGNVYVGDRGNHRVVVYSSTGKVERAWGKEAPQHKEGDPPPPVQPGEFAQINDVAVGDDGTVYVFDDNSRVQAFNQQGEYKGSFEPDQLSLYGPNGIAAGGKASDPMGIGVYIAATGQNRIVHTPSIDAVKSRQQALPGSLESIAIGVGGSADHLEQPVDVVADPSGNGVLYTIDLKDRIVQLTPPSAPGQPWTITKQWPAPVGRADGGARLAISGDGTKVYMSDPDRQRVAALDVTNNQVKYFGRQGADSGQFTQPSGVAVGPDGKIYVVDSQNNNVQVFSPESVK